jgi:polar amino acid transport system substrate-binding protein
MRAQNCGLAIIASIIVSLSAANAQQSIKVGHVPFNAPIAFVPGATASNYRTLDPTGHPGRGALIDLMNSVAKDAGLQFQYIPIVAGEQVVALVEKKIDLMTVSAGGSPESKSLIVFTAPVYVVYEALIVRRGDPAKYKTFDDLRGLVVGVQEGTVSADEALKAGIFAGVKQYKSGAELEKAVSDGGITVGIDSSAFGAIYRLQNDKTAGWEISRSYIPRFVNPNSIGARKSDEELVRKIEASLVRLKSDGTARAIFTKWGVERALAN